MRNLISNTEFGKLCKEKLFNDGMTFQWYFEQRNKYDEFLSKNLELGDFIPCDENGNVLEEPSLIPSKELLDYRQAKSKVIFEGFDIYYRDEQTIILCNNNNDIIEFATNGSVYVFDEYSAETIEDLTYYAKKEQVDLTLNDNFKL